MNADIIFIGAGIIGSACAYMVANFFLALPALDGNRIEHCRWTVTESP